MSDGSALAVAVGVAAIIGCAIGVILLFVRIGVYHGTNTTWMQNFDQRLARIERAMNGFLTNNNHGGHDDA